MVASIDAVNTALATSNGSAKDDAQFVGELAKIWVTHNKRSLEARSEIGKRLNDRLGPPTERQPRGRSLLKKAALRLQISESELNRMRWFAYFSNKDEESFWGDIASKDRSWTQFKAILPRLDAAENGNEERRRSSAKKGSTAVVNGLLRSLISATSKLRGNNLTVGDAKKEALFKSLCDLVSAVSTTCGIRFRLEAEEASGDGCATGLILSQCPMDTVVV